MNKKGEILVLSIFLLIILTCVILVVLIILSFQINTQIVGIKDSVFYMGQNAILACDLSKLAYDKYVIDYNKLYSMCNELIIKNHLEEKNKVNNISIQELKVITSKEECIYHSNGVYDLPILHIVLNINFNTILNNEYSVSIHEDVKMSLMEY